jgi:tRNA(Glu) U13 pseudouridine synthase TruD
MRILTVEPFYYDLEFRKQDNSCANFNSTVNFMLSLAMYATIVLRKRLLRVISLA